MWYENIAQMGELCIVGIAVAGVTSILQHSFHKGNIFEKWLPFIASVLVSETPELMERLKSAPTKEYQEEIITEIAFNESFWYKPLGGCGVCMNVWVCFIACIAVYFTLNINVLMLPILIGVAGFSFRLITPHN